jgi:hypothetical protein
MDERDFRLIGRLNALETFIRDINVSIILQQQNPLQFLDAWKANIEKRASEATYSGDDPAISDMLAAETGEAMLNHVAAVSLDVRKKLGR